MNPSLPPLRLAKLHTSSTASSYADHPSNASNHSCQSGESGFSVTIDTPVDKSLPSPSVEDLSSRDDQRFQHAQDSFRQLIHRKSSQAVVQAAHPGRRHSTGAVSVLTRRESMRPKSLFDAQDSMREMIRRHSLRKASSMRRWSLPGDTKAVSRIHVTTTTTAAPSVQTLRVAAPSSSDKCIIL